MTELLGVGGFVPKQICAVAPYLSNLQSHPDPMKFAVNTFTLMQVATYVAGFGAGGCMAFQFQIIVSLAVSVFFCLGILRRFSKDIVRIRKGDYGIFKRKKNNE
jgi:uncharacterized membrane protein